jgi:diguanylate cyclase (GGDEF)-like protein
MPGALSMIRNKVARRILLSFVVAALLPIGILGYFSYRAVGDQLAEQTARSLLKKSKEYGMRVLDNLDLAHKTLEHLTGHIKQGHESSSTAGHESIPGELAPQFEQIAITDLDAVLDRQNAVKNKLPDLSADDIQALDNGKPLLKLAVNPDQRFASIWLVLKLPANNKNALVMGKLKPERIWQEDSALPNDVWAYDANGKNLFMSSPNTLLPYELKLKLLKANKGALAWNHNGEAYVGAHWKIPMKTLFTAPDFVVVLGQPRQFAFAPLSEFIAIYPFVTLLAALIAIYLSIRFIVKYLKPLQQLKTATLKVAAGDFTHEVKISSQDEFEELGDSFNQMTQRLRSQFDIQAAMAEIDRSILSAHNAETIVDTALTRLPDVLACDLIIIARFNAAAGILHDIQTRKAGKEILLMPGTFQLPADEFAALEKNQNGVLETGIDSWTDYCLTNLRLPGSWCFAHVPVQFAGQLVSVISVGYCKPDQITQEIKTSARNFGDRIAVALSNAAWEEKLYHQAHFDALTGLPNRLVLNDRLEQELGRSKWDGTQLAVLFIDLDRFKNINDSLGHAAGDELLVQVATILAACIRFKDIVVRLGGDEFVVLLTDLPEAQNPASLVGSIADSILTALDQSLVAGGYPVTIDASIGIAMYPEDAKNAADLLKNADAAMYHAKDEGRGNFQFYSRDLNLAALENIRLEHDLRRAIDNQELRVFYQPKVDLTGKIVGAEALIRWQHKELGMVSPAKFIPLAEQSGLIVEIGAWVLEQVCLWVKANCALQFSALRVSVNLSALEFKHPNLVDRINDILVKTGVDPAMIELELTESVAVHDVAKCVARMEDLKALGLKLSLDDFGTGFSSLSYLKNLPLDLIKIDQTFVRYLENEADSQAIVQSILALAKGLNKDIVAEGVENIAQFDLLKGYGCGVFQGFYFSRPVCADDFLSMLGQKFAGHVAPQTPVS